MADKNNIIMEVFEYSGTLIEYNKIQVVPIAVNLVKSDKLEEILQKEGE